MVIHTLATRVSFQQDLETGGLIIIQNQSKIMIPVHDTAYNLTLLAEGLGCRAIKT